MTLPLDLPSEAHRLVERLTEYNDAYRRGAPLVGDAQYDLLLAIKLVRYPNSSIACMTLCLVSGATGLGPLFRTYDTTADETPAFFATSSLVTFIESSFTTINRYSYFYLITNFQIEIPMNYYFSLIIIFTRISI